jgi:hypothetical protein
MQTGVGYLARREAEHRFASATRLPQPIVVRLSEQQKEALVTITDPQGKEARVFPLEQHGQRQTTSSETRLPGFYRLHVGQESGVVAVNTPLDESDLTSIQALDLGEKFPGIPFAVVDWERGRPVRAPQVEPISMAGWFLIGLLVLMLVEGVLANRLR